MFKVNKLILFSILSLGLFLRLFGTNWDQGWHLHPDERFLTMVGIDVKIPQTLSQYLDRKTSSFNPVNKGHTFFVYGTFPILFNKILAEYFYNDTYDLYNLQGRVLSGIADFLIVLIIYRLIALVEKKMKFDKLVKYLAAFFYAIAVLPIQLSHFFTVDTFLNLFCWASLYWAVKLQAQSYKLKALSTCLSGLFFGLALACKVSAVYMAPLIGVFLVGGLINIYFEKGRDRSRPVPTNMFRIIILLIVFIISCYLALRLGSPYYFETNNIFNLQLSTVFVNSIKTLKSFDNPNALFPPAIQWLSKSYGFPIRNIIFFGVGPFYFLLSFIGLFVLLKKKNLFIIVSIFWLISFLIFQSFQFAKTMRYLLFIYPFLAISAAVGISYVFNQLKKVFVPSYNTQHVTHNIQRSYMLHIICYMLILFWPLAFMSIYTKDQSRVTASKWIYENIPSKSIILTEYWDDPLPLTVQDPGTRNYIGKEVHIFDPDTAEKWKVINDQMKSADYYIMSSNRGWGSIMEAPERYSIASEFYKKMFENKNGYTLIKKFTSFPSFRYLGIPLDFPDQWAEEAFTVYDHPEVMIFKRNK